jgi:hypothetical protein
MPAQPAPTDLQKKKKEEEKGKTKQKQKRKTCGIRARRRVSRPVASRKAFLDGPF